MKIKEASKILGISENTLRLGLQQNKFPFGTAVKTSTKYTYIFYPKKVKEYLKGE